MEVDEDCLYILYVLPWKVLLAVFFFEIWFRYVNLQVLMWCFTGFFEVSVCCIFSGFYYFNWLIDGTLLVLYILILNLESWQYTVWILIYSLVWIWFVALKVRRKFLCNNLFLSFKVYHCIQITPWFINLAVAADLPLYLFLPLVIPFFLHSPFMFF